MNQPLQITYTHDQVKQILNADRKETRKRIRIIWGISMFIAALIAIFIRLVYNPHVFIVATSAVLSNGVFFWWAHKAWFSKIRN